MAVFVTGPPGNTFAIFVRAVRDNQRSWRPASKRRLTEILRGLVGSLGMVKCSYGL